MKFCQVANAKRMEITCFGSIIIKHIIVLVQKLPTKIFQKVLKRNNAHFDTHYIFLSDLFQPLESIKGIQYSISDNLPLNRKL